MRNEVIMLSALAAFCGFGQPAKAQCVPVLGAAGQPETICGDFRPLRIAPAVLGDPALIWSASETALVPVPDDGRVRLVGRTIPLDALIGRKVVGVGRQPERVVYNNPVSLPGSVDPGLVLMRLPTLRRVAIRQTSVRVERLRRRSFQVLRVKD